MAQSSTGHDDASIVIGWLVRVSLCLVVVGVVCFDLLSVVTARITVEDDADAAARAAAQTWHDTHDLNVSYASAVIAATQANGADTVPAAVFRIAADGSVSLSVERTAPTVVAVHIPFLRDYTAVAAAGHAAPDL